MKDLIEYIAKSLVDSPNDVHIRQIEGEQSVILELRVAPDDMGKVIGKQGRVAKAMRTLLKIAAAREGRRVILEIA
ncbi:MAG: KH domain-containing protein [Chloroflexi bacterium]|nr:KH domain-containing protein [Chloroflexota bacterium]MDA8187890.1 KH domain-containing protein [Dehalococcoidales bacterium]